MKPLRTRRGWSYWHLYSSPLFLGLIGLGILGFQALTGKLDLASFGLGSRVSHEGMVAVPTSAGSIHAYTKITRDHVWDRQAGNISVILHLLELEVVLQLLPGDQVTQAGQVLDTAGSQLTVSHGSLVQPQVCPRGKLQ